MTAITHAEELRRQRTTIGARPADAAAGAAGLLLAIAVSASLIYADLARVPADAQWLAFGLVAGAMLLAERIDRLTIELGPGDTATLRPMFAYALLLLGPPSAALAVATVAHLVHVIGRRQRVWYSLVGLTRTLVTVGGAGLVLVVLGVRGSVSTTPIGPWWSAAAIVLGGVTLLVLDAVVTELAIALQRRTSFELRLRRGLPQRTTAVGSLLSLAPVWVVGLDSNIGLFPLLAISTFLVLTSTRRALARSHEAHHDALTGLANRRSFDIQLDDACVRLGRSRAVAVLLLDLDDFKQVNDRLGHDVGDQLLISFAERLVASLPSNAVAARLGGDEFAVLLTDSRRNDRLRATVHALQAGLDRPLTIAGFPMSIGVSIGAAYAPQDGEHAVALLHAADVAMYRSKRLRSHVEDYDAGDGALQTGRLGLLADLAPALAGDQFRVDYQPQLRVADGRVLAVEALVRWDHPEFGTIAPNDFIGLAEHTDLIGQITETIIRTAAAGLVQIGETDARLAVNVSVRNLQDASFPEATLRALAAAGFPPHRLELEITEEALITKPERSRATITALRQAGVRITLDGFGTGYSSYQTLRTLPIDRIKIDRDFVLRLLQDDQDQAVVRSIVFLGHELGVEVIAEGVEGAETWEVLATLGCDAVQGYGIAMPMGLPTLWSWLNQLRKLHAGPALTTTTDSVSFV